MFLESKYQEPPISNGVFEIRRFKCPKKSVVADSRLEGVELCPYFRPVCFWFLASYTSKVFGSIPVRKTASQYLVIGLVGRNDYAVFLTGYRRSESNTLWNTSPLLQVNGDVFTL